jgi:hypothetical protein
MRGLPLAVILRWPRKRPSKDAAEAPGPSPFEARLRRAPQGDGLVGRKAQPRIGMTLGAALAMNSKL